MKSPTWTRRRWAAREWWEQASPRMLAPDRCAHPTLIPRHRNGRPWEAPSTRHSSPSCSSPASSRTRRGSAPPSTWTAADIAALLGGPLERHLRQDGMDRPRRHQPACCPLTHSPPPVPKETSAGLPAQEQPSTPNGKKQRHRRAAPTPIPQSFAPSDNKPYGKREPRLRRAAGGFLCTMLHFCTLLTNLPKVTPRAGAASGDKILKQLLKQIIFAAPASLDRRPENTPKLLEQMIHGASSNNC